MQRKWWFNKSITTNNYTCLELEEFSKKWGKQNIILALFFSVSRKNCCRWWKGVVVDQRWPGHADRYKGNCGYWHYMSRIMQPWRNWLQDDAACSSCLEQWLQRCLHSSIWHGCCSTDYRSSKPISWVLHMDCIWTCKTFRYITDHIRGQHYLFKLVSRRVTGS